MFSLAVCARVQTPTPAGADRRGDQKKDAQMRKTRLLTTKKKKNRCTSLSIFGGIKSGSVWLWPNVSTEFLTEHISFIKQYRIN